MRCEAFVAAAMLAWSAAAVAGTPAKPKAPPMAPGSSAPASGKKGARPVVPRVVLETPHRVGAPQAHHKGDAQPLGAGELRQWNAGGTGAGGSSVPAAKGHPAPRVIVNVASITGGHDGKEVQRLARRFHWIQVIQCYRLGAYKDPQLHGWTQARMDIGQGGEVVSAELLDTELADRSVAECMVERLRSLRFPEAAEASSATLQMRVGPGDEPIAPPEERLGPGEGSLDAEAMRVGMRAGLARVEGCYRAALATTPELWGRMQLLVRVNEQGAVDEVFESGTQFPAPRMRQCVVAEVRRLRFAKPAGGSVRFVAAFRFTSNRARIGAPSVRPSKRNRSPKGAASPLAPKAP